MSVFNFLLLIQVILVAHFVADFITQQDAIAKGKSSSNRILLTHISQYSFVLFTCLFGLLVLHGLVEKYMVSLCMFMCVNGLLHGITDYFTSRWTKRLWENQRTHDFFVVIGLDQLIHSVTLISTAYLIFT